MPQVYRFGLELGLVYLKTKIITMITVKYNAPLIGFLSDFTLDTLTIF